MRCGQPLAGLPGTPSPLHYAGAVGSAARPGGLTALAVLNFIGAALVCVSASIALAAPAVLNSAIMADPAVTSQMSAQERADFDNAKELLNNPLIKILSGVDLLKMLLLVIAGIGYLKMRRVMGRMVGNLYAVVSLAALGVGMALLPAEVSGGFSILTIIGILYPVITLVLVNTTFKNDLVN